MDKKRLKDSSTSPVACGTGLLALDVVFADDRLEPIGRWAGGTFGNVMTILSFFGWKACPVCRLRDDDEALWILEDIKRWGVDSSFISLEPTGATPIIIEYLRKTENGATHRFSLRCPLCRKHLPSYRPITAKYIASVVQSLPDPAVCFFDRTSRAALDLASHCAELGGIVLFEPSGVGNPRYFREAIELAHIVKYSRERIAHSDVAPNLGEARLVIETLGRKGLRFARRLPSSKRLSWKRRPAYSVSNLEDAAGSGDWFTAGLIHELGQGGLASLDSLSDADLDASLATAQALAAWNCLYPTPRGGMYEVGPAELWKDVDAIKTSGTATDSPSSMSTVGPKAKRVSLHFCESCR